VTFETLDSLMCIVDFPLGGKQYFLGLTCIFSPIILLRKQFSFAGMSQVSAYRIWHTVVNWLNILMQNTKIVSHLTNDSYVVSKVDCSGKKQIISLFPEHSTLSMYKNLTITKVVYRVQTNKVGFQ
jgi:hypothetical protein